MLESKNVERPTMWLPWLLMVLGLGIFYGLSSSSALQAMPLVAMPSAHARAMLEAQQDPKDQADPVTQEEIVVGEIPVDGQPGRGASLIRVEFPLDSHRESALLARLERLANASSGPQRPVVVLEFCRPLKDGDFQRQLDGGVSEDSLLGRGTAFERALTVARWLTSPKGNRLHTIAYLPESVAGHAVLVALACEEIAMPLDVEFGKAGIDESMVDPTIRQAYVDTVERRGNVFPKAAVVSMLDTSDPLFRIDLLDGTTRYASKSELDAGKRQEQEWKEEQLVPTGHLGWFQGSELRTWKWVSYSARDREQLASLLRLSQPFNERATFDGHRVALRVGLHGKVSARSVDRVIRAIEHGLQTTTANLLLVEIDSPGGSLEESLRLAQYIADLSTEMLEVVCYIPHRARGDAAVIALACDSVYMHSSAIVGGPGEANITAETCKANYPGLRVLANDTGRTIGLLMGVVCSDLPIYAYSTFDGRHTIANPEFLEMEYSSEEFAQWNQGQQLDFKNGVDVKMLQQNGVECEAADSWSTLAVKYNLQELPPEIRTNRAEQFVDWLSSQIWLSFFLFFVGLVALSAELGAPGIGFPGLLAGICFGLFFWLRMLDGTVEWLEILLIVGGILCLLLEILVLPGFGLFGISGLIMLGLGLLLAGQTFVWPTNDYQRLAMMKSMGQIATVVLLLGISAFTFRRQIMAMPMVKWLSIEAPVDNVSEIEQLKHEEELHALIGWTGHTMTRCNPLGRANIAGKIINVVSDDGWIDEDTEIVVTDAQSQKLVVRRKV